MRQKLIMSDKALRREEQKGRLDAMFMRSVSFRSPLPMPLCCQLQQANLLIKDVRREKRADSRAGASRASEGSPHPSPGIVSQQLPSQAAISTQQMK